MNHFKLDEKPYIRCSYKELRDPANVVEHPRNPNSHPEKQIEILSRVIWHQGWRNPIVVLVRSGFVISGHGRLEAAKLLGCDVVPVDVQEFATEIDVNGVPNGTGLSYFVKQAGMVAPRRPFCGVDPSPVHMRSRCLYSSRSEGAGATFTTDRA